MSEPDFTFVVTLSRSFVLNGKRHTVKYPNPLPAGKYRLVRMKDAQP